MILFIKMDYRYKYQIINFNWNFILTGKFIRNNYVWN